MPNRSEEEGTRSEKRNRTHRFKGCMRNNNNKKMEETKRKKSETKGEPYKARAVTMVPGYIAWPNNSPSSPDTYLTTGTLVFSSYLLIAMILWFNMHLLNVFLFFYLLFSACRWRFVIFSVCHSLNVTLASATSLVCLTRMGTWVLRLHIGDRIITWPPSVCFIKLNSLIASTPVKLIEPNALINSLLLFLSPIKLWPR